MTLSASAQRVQDALSERGLAAEVVELPGSTRSAAEAASAVGCTVAQIAKSIVFETKSGEMILVVASGAHRVDEKKLAVLAGAKVKRADPERVRERLGFAIGGVPPLGHRTPVRTFLDRELLALDPLWAAAGTPHAVFRLTASELLAITGGDWVDVAAIPREG